jgi:hypothetical protein
MLIATFILFLFEWLVTQAEQLSGREKCVEAQGRAVGQLCRKARAISRFVYLWTDPGASRCPTNAECLIRLTASFSSFVVTSSALG